MWRVSAMNFAKIHRLIFATSCLQEITRNVGTPKGRPTWRPPPPSRWLFQRVGENYGPVLAVSGPTFMIFWNNVYRGFFVVPNAVFRFFIVFLTGDIGSQSWHWVAKSSKIGSFGAPNFWGSIPKNIFVVFYCRPIYVMYWSFVKIRSDVSTDSILKKQHLQNRCRRHRRRSIAA